MKFFIKNKISELMSSKILILLIIGFFISINLQLIQNVDLLKGIDLEFNIDEKYGVIFNSFVITTASIGLAIAIFLGINIISGDKTTGYVYLVLNANPNRIKYYLYSFLVITFVILAIFFLALINVVAVMVVASVPINAYDLIFLFVNTIVNMMIIASVSGVVSIISNKNIGVIAGIVILIIFNIHSYAKVPFTNIVLNLDIASKKVLFYIAPIMDIFAPSLTGNEEIYKFAPVYSLVDYLHVYRIGILAVMNFFGLMVFRNKDI